MSESDFVRYTPSREEVDIGIRTQALHAAQSIIGGASTATRLIEEAQIIEGYLRDGHLPAPPPQQAKAA